MHWDESLVSISIILSRILSLLVFNRFGCVQVTVWRNAAYSLLQDEYLDRDFTDEEASTKRKTDRRSVIKEMISEGCYFEGTFSSTFRRHRALVIAQIKRIDGPKDILKQRQLAQSLLDHYTGVATCNCTVCQPYCAICAVYCTGLSRILHSTVSYIARWFSMLHCALIIMLRYCFKGIPRYRARVSVIMTHRKVRIRDKNAYLTLVPSESSRQADSYSISHSWLPTTDVVCATSTSRVPIESSCTNNQTFVQKSGVPLTWCVAALICCIVR